MQKHVIKSLNQRNSLITSINIPLWNWYSMGVNVENKAEQFIGIHVYKLILVFLLLGLDVKRK